jgi:hypothetical protein
MSTLQPKTLQKTVESQEGNLFASGSSNVAYVAKVRGFKSSDYDVADHVKPQVGRSAHVSNIIKNFNLDHLEESKRLSYTRFRGFNHFSDEDSDRIHNAAVGGPENRDLMQRLRKRVFDIVKTEPYIVDHDFAIRVPYGGLNSSVLTTGLLKAHVAAVFFATDADKEGLDLLISLVRSRAIVSNKNSNFCHFTRKQLAIPLSGNRYYGRKLHDGSPFKLEEDSCRVIGRSYKYMPNPTLGYTEDYIRSVLGSERYAYLDRGKDGVTLARGVTDDELRELELCLPTGRTHKVKKSIRYLAVLYDYLVGTPFDARLSLPEKDAESDQLDYDYYKPRTHVTPVSPYEANEYARQRREFEAMIKELEDEYSEKEWAISFEVDKEFDVIRQDIMKKSRERVEKKKSEIPEHTGKFGRRIYMREAVKAIQEAEENAVKKEMRAFRIAKSRELEKRARELKAIKSKKIMELKESINKIKIEMYKCGEEEYLDSDDLITDAPFFSDYADIYWLRVFGCATKTIRAPKGIMPIRKLAEEEALLILGEQLSKAEKHELEALKEHENWLKARNTELDEIRPDGSTLRQDYARTKDILALRELGIMRQGDRQVYVRGLKRQVASDRRFISSLLLPTYRERSPLVGTSYDNKAESDYYQGHKSALHYSPLSSNRSFCDSG